MKLNLGSGQNVIAGYVNVDKFPHGKPEVVWDLEVAPWPFEENVADEITMNHSLEHMGQTTEGFFRIMQELYRVSKPGATIYINVPNPRHDSYWTDPTHVRPLIPETFGLFSKKNNLHWKEIGAANSPLALYLDVDFELVKADQVLDPLYSQLMTGGHISDPELKVAIRERNNIVMEYHIVLKVVK